MDGTAAGRAPGCLPMLGGPLLAFGLWLIAQAFLLPHEAEAVRLSVITGAFAALLGGWMLAARMRRMFARRDAVPAPAPTSEAHPAAADGTRDRGESKTQEALSAGIGCLVIPLSFLVVGPIFLWLYFSGVPTRRGNPVMGLVGGIVFSSLGLLGVWVLITGELRRWRDRRLRDPRRLP